MRYTVRPISDRKAFTGKHERSRFDSTWSRTQAQLFTEVRQLRGRDLVLELDVSERHIRIDGGLYANARPETPAVRVAFESMHGPLTYATDRFSTWQDNVRGIALGLEALRKVDRYGITKRGEQYAGWKALPSGRAMPASHMTTSAAAELLRSYSVGGAPLEDAWKSARRITHPDRNAGDHTAWNAVEEAARVLGLAQ